MCLPFKVKIYLEAMAMRTGNHMKWYPEEKLSIMVKERVVITAERGKIHLPLSNPQKITSRNAPALRATMICKGVRVNPSTVIPRVR
jgi:hypothetical protein